MERIDYARADSGKFHALRWVAREDGGEDPVRVCTGAVEDADELELAEIPPPAEELCGNCRRIVPEAPELEVDPDPAPEAERPAPRPVGVLAPGVWVTARFLVGGPRVVEAKARVTRVEGDRVDVVVPPAPGRIEIRLDGLELDPAGSRLPSWRMGHPKG